jgi:hypothetical protein
MPPANAEAANMTPRFSIFPTFEKNCGSKPGIAGIGSGAGIAPGIMGGEGNGMPPGGI